MEVRAGYKQTDVGTIPEDWTVNALGEIGESLIGLTYQPNDVRSDGTLVLRSSNIQQGALRFDDNVYVQTQVPEKIMVREGDILICVRNGSRELIGKCVMLDERAVGMTFGAFMAVFRCPMHDFVYYQFQSGSMKRQIHEHLGATINQITNKSLNSFLIPIPPLAEQRTIAEALSDADDLIESLEQLIAKKRRIKHGAMQELLTGKRRLPGSSGEWETKHLGELGTTFGGITGKSKRDFGHGDARYITFMNVMTNVVIDCATFESVDIKPAESQHRVARGDLFFNGSSETPEEVGMCAVLLENVQGVYLNSFCFGFRPREGAPASGLYLAYYFRSLEGRKLLASLAQGATRYNLSKTALLRVPFSLPTVSEQAAIATVLSDMDAEIDALEERTAKAREIKQGMMQELLTGRIRLL